MPNLKVGLLFKFRKVSYLLGHLVSLTSNYLRTNTVAVKTVYLKRHAFFGFNQRSTLRFLRALKCVSCVLHAYYFKMIIMT